MAMYQKENNFLSAALTNLISFTKIKTFVKDRGEKRNSNEELENFGGERGVSVTEDEKRPREKRFKSLLPVHAGERVVGQGVEQLIRGVRSNSFL
ncbi:hypothetical protein NPIL_12021 [Nephila pilipes]|uniref:Uncharacterized protein n=1 Tax=Nephila pilipes TaxID=299642 RepID=A0A8X6QSP9_NEPPI|nr:hypothetical protein NPIL_12021 [Nephila pilipes]